jgi:hypothetical protein
VFLFPRSVLSEVGLLPIGIFLSFSQFVLERFKFFKSDYLVVLGGEEIFRLLLPELQLIKDVARWIDSILFRGVGSFGEVSLVLRS